MASVTGTKSVVAGACASAADSAAAGACASACAGARASPSTVTVAPSARRGRAAADRDHAPTRARVIGSPPLRVWSPRRDDSRGDGGPAPVRVIRSACSRVDAPRGDGWPIPAPVMGLPAPRRDAARRIRSTTATTAPVTGLPVPRRDGPRGSLPSRSSPRGRRTRTCRRRWRSSAAPRSRRGCRSTGR